MSANLKTTSLALFSSLAIGIVATGSASAAPCKQHRHVGVSNLQKTQALAKGQAKLRWARGVIAHDGKAFAHWKFARSKSLRAKRFGFQFRAIATARGCLGPSSLTKISN